MARSPPWRTSSSSRILNPRGRSSSSRTADRRTRKKPLIGSVTPPRRSGNSSLAADPQAAEISARAGPSPSARPARRYRLATARSAPSPSAAARRRGMTSGGCWRSASSTHTHGAAAARRPSTTAPPRPPVRWPPRRWMSETRQAPSLRRARSRMTSGVSSSLSSTKTISVGMPVTAAERRRSSSSILAASLRVGTSTASPGAGCGVGEKAGPACSGTAKVVWLDNRVPQGRDGELGGSSGQGPVVLGTPWKSATWANCVTPPQPGVQARPKRRTASRTNPCSSRDAARLVPSMKLIANRPWPVTSAR